ncbi:MAG TPA: hypothetical protein VG406_03840 [Isosphaeraceae bacterium]|nr:hypothetical protein [Isosphaeraceae bacterium]
MARERPTTADRALVRASGVWGRAGWIEARARLATEWRERIGAIVAGPDGAREALRDEHAAWARPDLARIDPSWFERALREESTAVRRAVVARLPAAFRGALMGSLGLKDEDLESDRPPHEGALATAMALWSERLVGGPSATDEDAGVVRAIARHDRRGRYKVLHLAGLAKLAYALGMLELGDAGALRPRDRERVEHFRGVWGDTDTPLGHVARDDLAAGRRDGLRGLPHLGLVTIGRLLGDVEPMRARWALQHLPYSVARQARAWMTLPVTLVPARALLAWEGRVLDVALDRLDAESRPPGDPGGGP